MSTGRRLKFSDKVNGRLAIFYGISSLIAAIVILVKLGVWLYQGFAQRTEFSMTTFLILVAIDFVLALIGYVTLRVGLEQLD
jgi:hypothetical protein